MLQQLQNRAAKYKQKYKNLAKVYNESEKEKEKYQVCHSKFYSKKKLPIPECAFRHTR